VRRSDRPVPDQAALFGVLSQIEALGIQLIEVRRQNRNPSARRAKLTVRGRHHSLPE
jgi:hypothetical protein